jgi:hypothetical protein
MTKDAGAALRWGSPDSVAHKSHVRAVVSLRVKPPLRAASGAAASAVVAGGSATCGLGVRRSRASPVGPQAASRRSRASSAWTLHFDVPRHRTGSCLPTSLLRDEPGTAPSGGGRGRLRRLLSSSPARRDSSSVLQRRMRANIDHSRPGIVERVTRTPYSVPRVVASPRIRLADERPDRSV